ncbi:MAG: phosphate uptake regulator PhoU [Archaeoglobaceae archaeon]
MEVRKLQLIGGSSYMLSLPKEWVRSNGLKQGDELYLKVENSVVTIYPKKFFEVSRITGVKVDGLPRHDEKFLRRYLYAIYIQGVDEIEIRDENINARIVSRIGEIVKDLIGMEIIDASENYVRLKCLAATDFDVYSVVRRMTQIVRSMLSTLLEATNNPEVLEDVETLERDADRLYLLAVRQEHRLIREYSSPTKWNELRLILGIRTVAKLLEEIADSLYDFSVYAKKTDVKSLGKSIEEISGAFDTVCDAYFGSDVGVAEDAIERLEKIEEMCLADMGGDVFYRLALEAIVRASRHMKSIAEIAFNKAVRESLQRSG